jgi:hypothetical protein
MKTVVGVRVAVSGESAGFDFLIPNPPIRQAQRPAATQKIITSSWRFLSLFAATVFL